MFVKPWLRRIQLIYYPVSLWRKATALGHVCWLDLTGFWAHLITAPLLAATTNYLLWDEMLSVVRGAYADRRPRPPPHPVVSQTAQLWRWKEARRSCQVQEVIKEHDCSSIRTWRLRQPSRSTCSGHKLQKWVITCTPLSTRQTHTFHSVIYVSVDSSCCLRWVTIATRMMENRLSCRVSLCQSGCQTLNAYIK